MQVKMNLEAFKSSFFDRAKVQRAVDKATRRNLSKGGSFIRQRAMTSMLYRKPDKISPAGSPPFAHREGRGALLRKLLFFGFDVATKSVVIGPAALGKAEAPNLEEFGGTAKRNRVVRQVSTRRISPAQKKAFLQKVKTGEIVRDKAPTKGVVVKYPARPFMGPALKGEIAKGTIASVWKNSIKGS